MAKPKVQKIRSKEGFTGWLDGDRTYLECEGYGYLSGKKLYRLAKAIVKRFEYSPLADTDWYMDF